MGLRKAFTASERASRDLVDGDGKLESETFTSEGESKQFVTKTKR